MAFLHNAHTRNYGPGIFARISRAVSEFFAVIIESQTRLREVERLQKKSSAELSRMGLTRDEIGQHVFRDHVAY